jgi:hypothetical protein
MKYFQYINQNLDRSKYEVSIGHLSYSIMRHFQIYSRYDYYRKLGNAVSKSVLYTSEDMDMPERSIFRIIKKMEKEL